MPETIPTDDIGQAPMDVSKPDVGDLTLWSVTTIISVLDKPALLYWAAEQTAAAAVAAVDSLPARLTEDGPDETIKWLRDARFRRPRGMLTAAALGTVIHAVCEDYALVGVRPDRAAIEHRLQLEGGGHMSPDDLAGELAVVDATVDQFDRVFLQRFAPEYLATEVTMYSPTYGYAGTADGFVKLDGHPVILDYKTSRESFDKAGKPRHPYPEVALQLAAYRHAEMAAVWRPRRYEQYRRRYYLLSPEEQALAVAPPEVTGGVVVHLSPERCSVYPVACDETIHEAFLYVQEAARFVNTTARQVIGSELIPPEVAA